MPSQPVQLVRFDPAGASDDEWQDYATGIDLMLRDTDPQAPSQSLDEYRTCLQQHATRPDVERVVLLAHVDGKMAGILLADFLRPASTHYTQDGHTGTMQIFVLPAYRRRGIATVFLEQVVEIASQRGVTTLNTPASHEEGAAFATEIGMQELPQPDGGQLFSIEVDELAAHLGL
jgi:GNAT superfamily N-acetyltransferase